MDNTKFVATTGATYESIVADGASGEDDSEGTAGGTMSRTLIPYLKVDGDNQIGVRAQLYMQASKRVETVQSGDNDLHVGIFDYNGDPNGNKTPAYAGQLCRRTDTTPDDIYIAIGTANTEWELITNV